MRKRANPDEATLTAIKRAAILEMLARRIIGLDEISRLDALHVDDVLDRVFQHCGMLRVRVTDDRYIEIYPRPDPRSFH